MNWIDSHSGMITGLILYSNLHLSFISISYIVHFNEINNDHSLLKFGESSWESNKSFCRISTRQHMKQRWWKQLHTSHHVEVISSSIILSNSYKHAICLRSTLAKFPVYVPWITDPNGSEVRSTSYVSTLAGISSEGVTICDIRLVLNFLIRRSLLWPTQVQ